MPLNWAPIFFEELHTLQKQPVFFVCPAPMQAPVLLMLLGRGALTHFGALRRSRHLIEELARGNYAGLGPTQVMLTLFDRESQDIFRDTWFVNYLGASPSQSRGLAIKVGTTGIRGQTSFTEHTGVSLRGVLDVRQLNFLGADRYGGQSLWHVLVTSSLRNASHRGSDLRFIRLKTHFLLKSDPGPAHRLSQAHRVLFDRLLEFVLNLVLWVE